MITKCLSVQTGKAEGVEESKEEMSGGGLNMSGAHAKYLKYMHKNNRLQNLLSRFNL